MTIKDLIRELIIIEAYEVSICNVLHAAIDTSVIAVIMQKLKILEDKAVSQSNAAISYSASDFIIEIFLDKIKLIPFASALLKTVDLIDKIVLVHQNSHLYFESALSPVIKTADLKSLDTNRLDEITSILKKSKKATIKNRIDIFANLSKENKDSLKHEKEDIEKNKTKGIKYTSDSDFMVKLYGKIKLNILNKKSNTQTFMINLRNELSGKADVKIEKKISDKLNDFFASYKANILNPTQLEQASAEMNLMFEFYFWSIYYAGGKTMVDTPKFQYMYYEETRRTYFPKNDLIKATIDYLITKFPTNEYSYLNKTIVKRSDQIKSGSYSKVENESQIISQVINHPGIFDEVQQTIKDNPQMGSPKDKNDPNTSYYDNALEYLLQDMRLTYSSIINGGDELMDALNSLK